MAFSVAWQKTWIRTSLYARDSAYRAFWRRTAFQILRVYHSQSKTRIGVSLPGVRDIRRASGWFGALPMVARLGKMNNLPWPGAQFVPHVWSSLGPVKELEVSSASRTQSKTSLFPLVHAQMLSSKSQLPFSGQTPALKLTWSMAMSLWYSLPTVASKTTWGCNTYRW